MKITVNAKVSYDICTGCGACVNSCPVNAISMRTDPEGFLSPEVDEEKCIECKNCIAVCPVLTYENHNSEEPEILAVRAADKVRALSSSGGVFTVLAEEILSEGGAVCGAAFDKDMILRHVLVEEKEGLKRLRGSKYLQSDSGDVYLRIRELLTEGRKVLFSGTPCQNAALRNILGEDPDDLLQIDILCHGVPSQTAFSEYLKEVANGKTVRDVKFRSKEFGWQFGRILIEFDDNIEYIGNIKSDAFIAGFHRNLILRKACAECKYSAYPREGDISIGDFWGISQIDASQNDGKGTSIVFLNNEKGKRFFRKTEKRFYEVQEYSFQEIGKKLKNRIDTQFPANAKRDAFFQNFAREKNFYDSVKKTIPETLNGKPEFRNRIYDIGLVSNYLAVNFGGSLTQYALYNVLKDLGYSVGMIERPYSAHGKADDDDLKKVYLECPYDKEDLIPRCSNREEMRQLNSVCRQFVVGSDQLFQYALYQELDKLVSLSWVKDRKKKTAYAASFGHNRIWGNINELAELGYFLQKYDAFSVREKDAVQLCQKHFGVEAEWVLDPVFLCDKEVYTRLAEKSPRKRDGGYIASYILDPSSDRKKILEKVMAETGLSVEIFSEMRHSVEYVEPLGDLNVVMMKSEERLESIMHCEYFVTDSFHGTCLAIIMNKPFISILNTKRGGSRFTSLLEIFGLKERLIRDSRDLEKRSSIIKKKIDYKAVNLILQKEKERSLTWLKEKLKAPKKNIYSDYDIMKELIEEQRSMIDSLQNEIKTLARMVGKEGRYIEDIYEYLDYLYRIRRDHIILLAVKDTLGLALSERVSQGFRKLGIKHDLQGKHGRSFAAVLNGGENVYEEMGKDMEPIETSMEIDNTPVKLISRVYHNGNEARIEWDDTDYAVNERGMNIVVIAKDSKVVEDTVCFDTHLKGYTCFRKKGNTER
ncbi:MAG TPA: Coenzyme F420 hydrogenase/dehydrogenase, beta subunit C-terminal domain [Candidatus Mediterraneibacter norfolkensis]|nr:Coenzyme F420 hydrogenase/dehydrogenase, beta subunit C-terminal domain [Candidatus Mediterraneibacter norfolkensis]